MKNWLAFTILLTPCEFAASQQPPPISPKDRPAFVSVGAVMTFENLCLLTYPDREKFGKWQDEHADSRLDIGDFKQDPTDETYRIPTPAVSFIMNVARKNSCTLFSEGTSREVMEEELRKMLAAYTELGKGGTLKVTDVSGASGHNKRFQVLSPGGVPYIDVIYSDSTGADGLHSCAITGATKRREGNPRD